MRRAIHALALALVPRAAEALPTGRAMAVSSPSLVSEESTARGREGSNHVRMKARSRRRSLDGLARDWRLALRIRGQRG